MYVASLTGKEQEGLKRGEDFVKMGSGYSLEHATRPGTIGIVLGSSPVALLAWIGEKFFAWSDQAPERETILESVTLYWLTETFPTSIYPYRMVCHSQFKILNEVCSHCWWSMGMLILLLVQ
jgi:microsomal epoxide hydrolase